MFDERRREENSIQMCWTKAEKQKQKHSYQITPGMIFTHQIHYFRSDLLKWEENEKKKIGYQIQTKVKTKQLPIQNKNYENMTCVFDRFKQCSYGLFIKNTRKTKQNVNIEKRAKNKKTVWRNYDVRSWIKAFNWILYYMLPSNKIHKISYTHLTNKSKWMNRRRKKIPKTNEAFHKRFLCVKTVSWIRIVNS